MEPNRSEYEHPPIPMFDEVSASGDLGGLECRFCEHFADHACVDSVDAGGQRLRLFVLMRNGPLLARLEQAHEAEIEVRACGRCGCTDEHACAEGCGWQHVEDVTQALDVRALFDVRSTPDVSLLVDALQRTRLGVVSVNAAICVCSVCAEADVSYPWEIEVIE